jgi:hypothetical protein
MEALGNGFLPPKSIQYETKQLNWETNDKSLGSVFHRHQDKIRNALSLAESMSLKSICQEIRNRIGPECYEVLRSMLSWPGENIPNPCDGGQRYYDLMSRIKVPQSISSTTPPKTPPMPFSPTLKALTAPTPPEMPIYVPKIQFSKSATIMFFEGIPRYFYI